ncbi:MAG: 2-dehydropantoate 2-reductase [Bacillus sp. (in: firmicutes)]
MKIGIIGGGAIGLLCAYFFTKSYDVTLYVRSEKQLKLLKQNGIIYRRDKLTENRKVNVELFSNWAGKENLTIITVKQYQLEAIYTKINLNSNHINDLLFLQNGMSHLKVLKTLPVKQILVGIVEHGAVKTNAYSVHHLGVGMIKLSALQPHKNALLTQLVQGSQPSFMIKEEQGYLHMMKKKLVVNSLVNTLTSILQIRNGELLENPFFFNIMDAFMTEIAEIMELKKEEKELYFSYVVEVIKKTANNKSSMLKDIEERRHTEIDSILGYLLDEASQKKKAANLTKTFYFMIKGKETE